MRCKRPSSDISLQPSDDHLPLSLYAIMFSFFKRSSDHLLIVQTINSGVQDHHLRFSASMTRSFPTISNHSFFFSDDHFDAFKRLSDHLRIVHTIMAGVRNRHLTFSAPMRRSSAVNSKEKLKAPARLRRVWDFFDFQCPKYVRNGTIYSVVMPDTSPVKH